MTPPTCPCRPPSGASLVPTYAVHAALAAAVLAVSVTRPLHGIPQPTNLRLWFPLGFAASSLIAYVMAWRLDLGQRNAVLGLDLAAWLALPACIIACRVNVGWTPAWMTGALAIKTGACLVAIFMAARARQGQRLAGLALGTQFLNVSLLSLPYTRYPGMPNAVGLTGDEPHYLAVTAALLYYHSFYTGRIYGSEIFARIYGGTIPLSQAQGRYVAGGHFAPVHDLGLSIMAVPLFASGGDLAVEIAMAVLAAATVYLTYRLVVATGVRSDVAVSAVAASTFLLPFLPYATTVLAEIPMAFVAVATSCYLVGTSRSRLAYAGVTVLLALLPWIHARAWGLMLPLLIGLVLVELSWPRRAIAPIVAGISEVVYLALLRNVYGQFLMTPNAGLHLDLATLTATKVLVALQSPFLDPDNGLFLIAPVFLIAFAAWPALARKGTGWLMVLITVAFYCLELGVTALYGVGGGFSPPGRLMVSCAPLLAPALALGLVRLRIRGLSAIFWLLVGYGALCAFAVFANRGVAFYPGTLRALASTLQIRGPTVTVSGPGPWYATSLTIAVLLVLALLLYFRLPGSGRERLASSDLDARTAAERR